VVHDTPYDYKNWITEQYSSLVQTESRAAVINGEAEMMELTWQHQPVQK
jgi:hypothetical protein